MVTYIYVNLYINVSPFDGKPYFFPSYLPLPLCPLSLSLSVYLCISLCVSLSASLSICLSLYISLAVTLCYIYMYRVILSLCVPLSLSLSLSVPLSLSLCTSLCTHRYFETFGAIETAEVLYNRITGKSRGFGFVTFTGDESVDNVRFSPKTHVQFIK